MTWRTLPLKRVASIRVSNIDKKSVGGQVRVRLCNYTDVYYRDSLDPTQAFMSATATVDQLAVFRIERGDVIVTKDSETADDIGIPSYVSEGASDLVCGYHLALLRPVQAVIDGRFLFWATASELTRSQFEVAATGITRFGLRSDSIGNTAVPMPPIDQQRTIADFLDAETARIDALIAMKARERALLLGRLRSECDLVTRPLTPGVQVRRVVSRLTSGPRGWAQHFTDQGGARFITIGSLQRNDIELDLTRAISVKPPMGVEAARASVHRGDVLLSITAEIGSVGVARTDGGFVSQHVALMTPHGCDADWLAFAMFAPFVQAQLDSLMYGGTKGQLALEDIAGIRVPVPETRLQKALVARLKRSRDVSFRAAARIDAQIELLRERRRALITAAVTGELEVPGVAAA